MSATETRESARRLLLIEDNPGDAGIVLDALSRAQSDYFAVTWVRSLTEALACLSKDPIDVLMLDLSLPDSSGLETLNHIRARRPDLPIVVSTGNSDIELGLSALRAGAQEFVVKGSVSGEMLVREVVHAIERYRYAAELKRYRDHLTELVDQRTEELRGALSQLQEVDRARSEFVSNVSHELKTPLTSMSYAFENLLEGVVGPISEAVRSYLLLLAEDCGRLRHTVMDILDMSRIDAHSLDLHRVDVLFGQMCEAVVGRLQAHADAKEITLGYVWEGPPLHVFCDVQKLERAITNVVENAIKFTARGGRVDVLARCCLEDSARVCVQVTDNGVGIPREHLEGVTRRYYRVGSHVDGAGLGLAIAKELLEHHGGTLVLESPPAGQTAGTQVRLVLPVSGAVSAGVSCTVGEGGTVTSGKRLSHDQDIP